MHHVILIVKPGRICSGSLPQSLSPVKGGGKELHRQVDRKASPPSGNCQGQAFHIHQVVNVYISSSFQVFHQLRHLKK